MTSTPARHRPCPRGRGGRRSRCRAPRRPHCLFRSHPVRAGPRTAHRRLRVGPHHGHALCRCLWGSRAGVPHLLAGARHAGRGALERSDSGRAAAPVAGGRPGGRDAAHPVPAAARRADPALPARLALSGHPAARPIAAHSGAGRAAAVVRPRGVRRHRGLDDDGAARRAAARRGRRRGSAQPGRHRRRGGRALRARSVRDERGGHPHRPGAARSTRPAVAARGDPARRPRSWSRWANWTATSVPRRRRSWPVPPCPSSYRVPIPGRRSARAAGA